MVKERLDRQPENPAWELFQTRNADLFDQSQNLLSRCYRSETLFSDLARSSFVKPDLMPLGNVDYRRRLDVERFDDDRFDERFDEPPDEWPFLFRLLLFLDDLRRTGSA